MNRWVASEPRRMLEWFIAVPMIGVLASLVLLLAGSPAWWLAAAGSAVALVQSVVYAPRAYRAMRRRDEPASS